MLEKHLADLDRLGEVAGLLVAPDQREADLDLEHVPDARGQQGFQLDDGVVDEALRLQGSGDQEPGPVGVLLEGGSLRSVTSVARLELGGLRVAGFQGELGEVEVQLDLLQLLRSDAHQQLLDGGTETPAQIGEHLEVRTTMSGLDAGDVTDRHVCAGQVGLGHRLGDSRSAQSLAQQRWVDLPEQVSLTGIHARQCDGTVANLVKNAISRGMPAQIAGLSRPVDAYC